MPAHFCRKCVACKEGLYKLYEHMKGLAKGYGFHEPLEVIRDLAEYVSGASDRVTGFQAAKMILEGLSPLLYTTNIMSITAAVRPKSHCLSYV
ncbi:MAG: hypothetical protein HUJ51_03335 [Eggerthellaceae bacterium]|nr:hypothetical protein [Eggerthellaceae bacterium]